MSRRSLCLLLVLFAAAGCAAPLILATPLEDDTVPSFAPDATPDAPSVHAPDDDDGGPIDIQGDVDAANPDDAGGEDAGTEAGDAAEDAG